MNNKSTIFIFDEAGNFLDVVASGDVLTSHSILGDIPNRTLTLLREHLDTPSHNGGSIFFLEPQEPDSLGYFKALAAEVTKLGYTAYLFDTKKNRTATLILSAKLPAKNNLEFFEMLTATPESSIEELYAGLKEDLAQKSPEL